MESRGEQNCWIIPLYYLGKNEMRPIARIIKLEDRYESHSICLIKRSVPGSASQRRSVIFQTLFLPTLLYSVQFKTIQIGRPIGLAQKKLFVPVQNIQPQYFALKGGTPQFFSQNGLIYLLQFLHSKFGRQ